MPEFNFLAFFTSVIAWFVICGTLVYLCFVFAVALKFNPMTDFMHMCPI
jgi:hypothetical protein